MTKRIKNYKKRLKILLKRGEYVNIDKIKVIMPQLGMTMKMGTIVEWKKKEGDKVKKDEIIVVVETEKIIRDLNAPQAGILKEILHEVGDKVLIGETIAIIETSG